MVNIKRMANKKLLLVAASWFGLIFAAAAFYYVAREVTVVVTAPCLAMVLYPAARVFWCYVVVVGIILVTFMNIVTGNFFSWMLALAALAAVRWLARYIHANATAKWGWRSWSAPG